MGYNAITPPPPHPPIINKNHTTFLDFQKT